MLRSLSRLFHGGPKFHKLKQASRAHDVAFMSGRPVMPNSMQFTTTIIRLERYCCILVKRGGMIVVIFVLIAIPSFIGGVYVLMKRHPSPW